MKGDTRITGLARIIGFLVIVALLLGLLLPLAGAAAQDNTANEEPTSSLSEVPTTGARRPGPIVLSGVKVRAPKSKPKGFAPVELVVDKIGLDAPVEQGVIADGVMQDPSGPWVVAWYSQLSKMGQGDNVVMAGHVDYWDTGPAIFQGVPSLVPGDIITVVGDNGETYNYSVEWAQLFDVASQLTPEVIQKDIVGDTGQESLTLITCGGEFNGTEYLQRFIVRANKI